MAVTIQDGIARFPDNAENTSEKLTVRSMTFVSDTTATNYSEHEIRTNDPIATIFLVRVPTGESHTIYFDPPRQFTQGIRYIVTSAGGGVLHELVCVLA